MGNRHGGRRRGMSPVPKALGGPTFHGGTAMTTMACHLLVGESNIPMNRHGGRRRGMPPVPKALGLVLSRREIGARPCLVQAGHNKPPIGLLLGNTRTRN